MTRDESNKLGRQKAPVDWHKHWRAIEADSEEPEEPDQVVSHRQFTEVQRPSEDNQHEGRLVLAVIGLIASVVGIIYLMLECDGWGFFIGLPLILLLAGWIQSF
jgi:hypothetical protein